MLRCRARPEKDRGGGGGGWGWTWHIFSQNFFSLRHLHYGMGVPDRPLGWKANKKKAEKRGSHRLPDRPLCGEKQNPKKGEATADSAPPPSGSATVISLIRECKYTETVLCKILNEKHPWLCTSANDLMHKELMEISVCEWREVKHKINDHFHQIICLLIRNNITCLLLIVQREGEWDVIDFVVNECVVAVWDFIDYFLSPTS